MSRCETFGSERSGWRTSWSETSGANCPGPKCTCAKRPGSKRPGLTRPAVKHAARLSHFEKLKAIKYNFNVVKGKSGMRVTKASAVVF